MDTAKDRICALEQALDLIIDALEERQDRVEALFERVLDRAYDREINLINRYEKECADLRDHIRQLTDWGTDGGRH